MQKGKSETRKKPWEKSRTHKRVAFSRRVAANTEEQDDSDYASEIEESEELTDEDFLPEEHVRRQHDERYWDRQRRVSTLLSNIIPGLPVDREAPELHREPKPLAAALERVLARYNIKKSFWLDDLKAAWPQLVAPEVARDAHPGKFKDGILYIFVSSSVRLFELRRTNLAAIEAAVRAFKGGKQVRQVRLMVDSVPIPSGE